MEEAVRAQAGQAADGGGDGGGSRCAGWRAAVVPVLVAMVLSVAATLLLGGAFRTRTAPAVASGLCGAAGPCCPPGVAVPSGR